MTLTDLVLRPDHFTAFHWTGENVDEAREFILERLGRRTATYHSEGVDRYTEAAWSVDYTHSRRAAHGDLRGAVLVVNDNLSGEVRVEPKHWLVARGGKVVEVIRDYQFQVKYMMAANEATPAYPEADPAPVEARMTDQTLA